MLAVADVRARRAVKDEQGSGEQHTVADAGIDCDQFRDDHSDDPEASIQPQSVHILRWVGAEKRFLDKARGGVLGAASTVASSSWSSEATLRP